MKRKIATGLGIALTMLSCQKQDIQQEIKNDSPDQEVSIYNGIIGDYDENMKNYVENDVVTYLLDGKEVKAGTYDPANEDLFVLIKGDSIDNYVHFNTFTTKEMYFEFGRDNGYGNS